MTNSGSIETPSAKPADGGQAPPQAPSITSALLRGFMMYMFMTIVTRKFVPVPPSSTTTTSSSSSTGTATTANTVHDTMNGGRGASISQQQPLDGLANYENARPLCIWKQHTLFDLHVFVTQESTWQDPYSQCPSLVVAAAATATGSSRTQKENHQHMMDHTKDEEILGQWHETNLELDSLDPLVNYKRDNITISIPKAVQFNETQIYAHVCLMANKDRDPYDATTAKVRDGPTASTTPTNNNNNSTEDYGKEHILYKSIPLTRYKLRKKKRDEKNLLESTSMEQEKEEEEENGNNIQSALSPLTTASANTQTEAVLLYLKPSLTLQLVDMTGMMVFSHRSKIPQPILSHMDWLHETSSLYYPLLYSSEFWITSDKLIPINDTISSATLQITLEQIKMWKWQLMSQMEETWRKQAEMSAAAAGGRGQEDDEGTDMLRTMLLETNPILLAITAIVSVLHTVFDFLAFKNDIKFFKDKKSMEGLSLRSMVVNTFFQIVILLYLVDNETSFMVIVSNGVGVVIEVWKITKAVNISLWDGQGKLKIEWKETESYTASKTKEYDEIATDHLMFVTMPLVCGYGLYSLFHQKHKGWYSWILNTLVGFIYMFGFVMMTPQLFINYKLQSVAHLNWRTMTYKSINTFIDDLFGEFTTSSRSDARDAFNQYG